MGYLQGLLGQYPTSVDEDQAQLSQEPPASAKADVLRLLISEKKILTSIMKW